MPFDFSQYRGPGPDRRPSGGYANRASAPALGALMMVVDASGGEADNLGNSIPRRPRRRSSTAVDPRSRRGGEALTSETMAESWSD